MKNRLLSYASVLATLALLLFASAINAQTITTLLSQDFSGGTFPPTTNQVGSGSWSANLLWNGNTSYGGTTPGWARSNGGSTGANGSAAAYTSTTYSVWCGGSSSYGPLLLTSPAVACNPGDSQYVDFDLYFPQNGYFYSGSYPQMAVSIDIMSGTTVLKTLNASTNSSSLADNTFYDGNYPPGDDPGAYGFTGSTYWRHYHIALPFGVSSTSVTFKKYETYGSCYYSYWYDDYTCFDNVVITSVANDRLTTVGPSPLSFANTPVGAQTASLYVKFKNDATKTITLGTMSIAGLHPNDFTITRSISSIAVGKTDSVGIAYNPTAAGARTANLIFTTNVSPANVAVILTGFGLSPSISIPQNLTLFAKQRVRFRQTITQSFVVTASGQVPLSIAQPPATFISGDNPNEYAIVRLPKTIAAGSTDTVTISFTPTLEGGQSGILNLASNAQQGTQFVPLKGSGILPRLVINNANSPFGNNVAVSFDSVNVGTQKCLQVPFFNPGTDTVVLTKNFLSGKDYDYSITPFSGADTAIAPGVTKMMNMCFTPLRSGFRTATMRVATNIPVTFPVNPPVSANTFGPDTSGFVLNITGTGVPFGTLAITGEDSAGTAVKVEHCLKDTLWNTGSADIIINKATLTGGDSSEFTTTLTTPVTIGAGKFIAFTICGTPSISGDRLTLFTASGMTGESAISSSLPVDIFGLNVCDSAYVVKALPAVTCLCSNGDTAIISIANCGDVATSYLASIAGADAADFSIVGPATSPVENGHTGVATFKVRYMPSRRATSTANLSITGGSGPAVIGLSGKGGAPVVNATGSAAATDVGKTSASFTVTVNNTGECDWNPGTPQLPLGSPFTYVSNSGVIAAGGSGTLTFTFAPTTSGTVTQDLTFPTQSCTPDASSKVSISGSTSAGVAMTTATQGYSIEQNFPNPFASSTQVTITLPKDGVVKLAIIDQTGKIVRTMLNQHMSAGSFNVTIDAGELSSGTYYYQMSANDIVLTRQMVIQK